MARVRFLALALSALLLAGCYRQADDSFQPIPNSGAAQTLATPTVEALPPVIDITATEALPGITEFAPTNAPGLLASATPQAAPPTGGDPAATPTLIIFSLPTDTPTPLNQTPPTALPTATPPQLITPELGVPAQVTIASPTPAAAVTGGAPGLAPTPTDLAEVVGGECSYLVQAGDNLFRIAIANNVTLQDLLVANDLTEQAVIQPGQALVIPGCVPGAAAAATATPAAPVPGLTTATALPGNVTVHRVGSGDTLTTIARRYGVSIQAIVDANQLTNPDRLQIGQELLIPQP